MWHIGTILPLITVSYDPRLFFTVAYGLQQGKHCRTGGSLVADRAVVFCCKGVATFRDDQSGSCLMIKIMVVDDHYLVRTGNR